MAFVPLCLVVGAAFVHATWNLLAKRAGGAGAAFVCAYNLVGCLACAPWAAWLILHGRAAWDPAALGVVGLSGLLHLAYSLCLQRGYAVADLSVVYPVARGTGPLLASLAAYALLGETPHAAGVAGLLAVVGGIVLISTQGRLAAFRRPGGQAGVRWGTATGALIAAYTVVDALAVGRVGVHPALLTGGTNLLQVVLLAPLVARDRARAGERMRGRWGLALAVGLLSPLAYILVLTALGLGAPLSVVAPAREMSMMVGALLGMLVLKEAVGPWRLAGCAVMIVGIVLLGRG